MVDIGETFETESHYQEKSYQLLQPGKYRALVKSVEIKETKAGNGNYFNIRLEVIEGDRTGANVFDLINFVNPSTEAQRIGREQLASLTNALSIPKLEQTEQLENKEVFMHVKIQEDKSGKYEPKNVVKYYSSVDGEAYVPGSDKAEEKFEGADKAAF